ncbi:hypothetical protein [Rhodococcus jostii]|uniref:hypothetical protein n=1 Tax=Rhodococcus jostii TaxID=132919 RepID=UPI003639C20D
MSAGVAALIVMQTSGHLAKSVSAMLLLRQLMKAMEAIADAHRASGELQRALDIEYSVRTELAAIHSAQPGQAVPDSARDEASTEQGRTTRSTLTPEQEELRRLVALDNAAPPSEAVRRPGSPIPAPLDPPSHAHAGRDRARGGDGNER